MKITLDLQIFSWIGKAIKKVTVNFKYYREHQPTCNILIMFIYNIHDDVKIDLFWFYSNNNTDNNSNGNNN